MLLFAFLVLLLTLNSAVRGRAHRPSKRIYDGFLIPKGLTECAVYLQIDRGASQAAKQGGGVILSSEYILTAAHNLLDNNNKPLDASKVMVGYGSGLRSEQTNTTGAAISIHPGFVTSKNTLDYSNDIALIKVPILSLYSTTSMVKIYKGDLSPGQQVLTVGWGKTESSTVLQSWLRGAVTSIGSLSECTKYIDGYKSSSGAQICSFNFSNPKKGSNTGDGGSAIVVSENGDTKLAGIASQIVYYANPKGVISGISHIDVNANSHIDFISKVTGLAANNFY